MRLTKRQLLIASLVLFWLVSPIAFATDQDDKLKQTMRNAFSSLSYLVNFALDDVQPDRADAEFNAALSQLENVSSQISDHTGSKPYSFNLVTRSLESIVGQMVRNYRAGLNQLGETYLVEAIDHCAACHAQSPDIAGTMDVGDFVKRIESEELDTSLAAQILIAVRRFSDAMAVWQRRLMDENFSLQQPGAEEAVLEYLFQATHLNSDKGNVYETLDSLRKNETTPYYLLKKLDAWRAQFSLIDDVDLSLVTLDQIASINKQCLQIEERSVLQSYPVCNVIESTLAGAMLRQKQDIDSALESELYLKMGIARMNTMISTGQVPQIDHFLEAAILAAPGTESAKSAYAVLEELAYFYYGELNFADEVMTVSLEGLKKIAGIK